jgi:D-alanine--D-alanine ligase
MKIALLCGGPSLERGISLNSARSVLDHLGGDGVEIVPIYFDYKKRAYRLSPGQMYSNTPSDFDFKLHETAKFLSKTGLKELLKSVDLAFPAIHGAFGEDGQVQKLLERYGVPYVGSTAEACRRFFDKYDANVFIREKGFFALPSEVLKINSSEGENKKRIEQFFKTHELKRAVVKPATGGSSIGVFSVRSVAEAFEKMKLLFGKRMDTRVVLEPFCEGTEFTVIVLQNRFGMPVAVLPTEVETDYTQNQIFDYRKKYLPTRQVHYHCPPRFSNEMIERIQVQAEQLFTILGVRDFARFDGWLLKDGRIWFSDFNPVSGMEQNSFLFQQAARIGFSHRDILRYVVKNACRRHGLNFPEPMHREDSHRKPVSVLFGGQTSERQVSLMSGTNAWLKLRRSHRYHPKPYFLDLHGEVWAVPYALTLNHTVEEVLENCEQAEEGEKRLHFLEEKVRLRLALQDGDATEPFFLPKKMSLKKFVEDAPFALIGLHGGIGEDGTLQHILARAGVKFNGSSEAGSKLCMDKARTGERLLGMEADGIFTAPKRSCEVSAFKGWAKKEYGAFFAELQRELKSRTLIVKPQSEGCSSGIVRLWEAQDLQNYLGFVQSGALSIPADSFTGQTGIVEMPMEPMKELLFEQFVETDSVHVKGNRLKWKRKKGWVEVTVGVLEVDGKLHALSPSLTVAEGEVLSVEEKFQGGTGVNMTPPPEQFVSKAVLKKVKLSVEKVAVRLGVSGYARIDTFMQIDTGDIIVLEANTAPALTPSTVLFHQGLAEPKPIQPLELLEKIVENKGY